MTATFRKLCFENLKKCKNCSVYPLYKLNIKEENERVEHSYQCPKCHYWAGVYSPSFLDDDSDINRAKEYWNRRYGFNDE